MRWNATIWWRFNADEQRLVRMREAADGRDLRDTVLHMLEQLGGKLLRLIRDDLEFHGLLEALDHRIADMAGQEAVDQAENDRLDLEIIDEVGQGRDDGIDGKHDPDDVHLRADMVDERRQQVRAAGAGVAAHDHAIAEAADDAARDRRKDRARAGSRMVLKRREVDIIQRQQHDGKHDCKRRGQHGIAVVYDIIRQQDERDVDEDRHIADLKMEHMLDDGRDARQAGRRELVGEHEDVVAQGKQTGAEHDDQIIQIGRASCRERV